MGFKEVDSDDSERVDQHGHVSSTSKNHIAPYDESLTEVEVMHCDYTKRSTHHFSFDPHVEDLMRCRCELSQIWYHLLWDGGLPSP